MACEKAVLISIRPEWVEKILRGEKTIEVRKTAPKIETPFKCYIYCTKPKRGNSHLYDAFGLNGKPVECGGYVVAEFTCNDTHCIVAEDFIVREDAEKALKGSGLTPQEAKKYAGWEPGTYRMDCKPLYGWHISNLKVYDEPLKIGDFKPWNRECKYSDLGLAIPECSQCHACRVEKAPQSWCYVEEDL